MALDAAIVWEVRNGGNDGNGGGFKTGASGTDRTLQDAAHATLTALSVVNADTTKITVSLTDYTVTMADVGNVYNNTGGSSTAGPYEIKAVDTVANTWTLDRSIGTAAQTCVGKMGGGYASPGYASGQMVDGNTMFIKYHATVYTISSNTQNISNGRIRGDILRKYIGYDTTRTIVNVDANRPTLKASTTLTNIIDNVNGFSRKNWYRQLIVDGNSTTTTGLLSQADQQYTDKVKVANCTTGFSQTFYTRCEAVNCPTMGFSGGTAQLCKASGCGKGFHQVNSTFCLSYSNTTGFADNGFGYELQHCVAYGNSAVGFEAQTDDRIGSGGNSNIYCISYGNGTYGFTTGENRTFINCAYGNNTSGNISGTAREFGSITLTADPFTNAAGGDFSLNNTAGGGALLRGLGFVFPGELTTSYLDIGAAQHQDAGGGGGGMCVPTTVLGAEGLQIAA